MAATIQVSVRLLDEMRLAGEIPFLLIRGRLVRFYWPDVLRKLKEQESQAGTEVLTADNR